MSRTYRLRHLPAARNVFEQWSPKKFVDAAVNKRFRGEEDLWRRLQQDYKARNLPFRHLWHLYEQKRLELRRLTREPVGPVWNHPWVGYGTARQKMKVYYKRTGNRRVRRKEKHLLQKWAFFEDDFEDYIPKKKDGWSLWDLW